MTRLGLNADTSLTTNLRGMRSDPYLAFNFVVEIEGLVAGGFSEVGGLQIEIETEDFREGGENGFRHKLPGPANYPQNLMLRHGLTDIDALWTWQQEVARGVIRRKNCTIYLLDQQGHAALWWDVRSAYPIRWSGPDFRADSTSVAVETVELAHRGIARSKGNRLIAAARELAGPAGRFF